jgi:hypothetical protein
MFYLELINFYCAVLRTWWADLNVAGSTPREVIVVGAKPVVSRQQSHLSNYLITVKLCLTQGSTLAIQTCVIKDH